MKVSFSSSSPPQWCTPLFYVAPRLRRVYLTCWPFLTTKIAEGIFDVVAVFKMFFTTMVAEGIFDVVAVFNMFFATKVAEGIFDVVAVFNMFFTTKVAEGIFDVVAVFNATNEYVLYYHSGKKTIRYFHHIKRVH